MKVKPVENDVEHADADDDAKNVNDGAKNVNDEITKSEMKTLITMASIISAKEEYV